MGLTESNIKHDAPLLAAVGLLHPDLTSFRMYILAGIVASTEPVRSRRIASNFDGEVLDVVEEMTDAEREELAERVITSARKQFPRMF